MVEYSLWVFPMAQWVKNTPAMLETQETQVRSLVWEDALEEEMATHSSVLAEKSNGQMSLAGPRPWGHRARHN